MAHFGHGSGARHHLKRRPDRVGQSILIFDQICQSWNPINLNFESGLCSNCGQIRGRESVGARFWNKPADLFGIFGARESATFDQPQ